MRGGLSREWGPLTHFRSPVLTPLPHQSEGYSGTFPLIANVLPHRKYKAVWSCLTRMMHPQNYKVCRRGGGSGPCRCG